MATLERPVAVDLETKICELLQGQDPPDTLEAILGKLRETEFVYKHEIARTVWRWQIRAALLSSREGLRLAPKV